MLWFAFIVFVIVTTIVTVTRVRKHNANLEEQKRLLKEIHFGKMQVSKEIR